MSVVFAMRPSMTATAIKIKFNSVTMLPMGTSCSFELKRAAETPLYRSFVTSKPGTRLDASTQDHQDCVKLGLAD
jgi:hypothetical protein